MLSTVAVSECSLLVTYLPMVVSATCPERCLSLSLVTYAGYHCCISNKSEPSGSSRLSYLDWLKVAASHSEAPLSSLRDSRVLRRSKTCCQLFVSSSITPQYGWREVSECLPADSELAQWLF